VTSVEEAYGWLSYADDMLQDAEDNLAMGKYGVAVSLAYYACFYAAKGVIAYTKERDPKTHSGVIIRFGELAVLGSDFPPEIAKSLAYLAEQRARPTTTWASERSGGATIRRRYWKCPEHSWPKYTVGSTGTSLSKFRMVRAKPWLYSSDRLRAPPEPVAARLDGESLGVRYQVFAIVGIVFQSR